jgi:hypothetical protein
MVSGLATSFALTMILRLSGVAPAFTLSWLPRTVWSAAWARTGMIVVSRRTAIGARRAGSPFHVGAIPVPETDAGRGRSGDRTCAASRLQSKILPADERGASRTGAVLHPASGGPASGSARPPPGALSSGSGDAHRDARDDLRCRGSAAGATSSEACRSTIPVVCSRGIASPADRSGRRRTITGAGWVPLAEAYTD